MPDGLDATARMAAQRRQPLGARDARPRERRLFVFRARLPSAQSPWPGHWAVHVTRVRGGARPTPRHQRDTPSRLGRDIRADNGLDDDVPGCLAHASLSLEPSMRQRSGPPSTPTPVPALYRRPGARVVCL